MKTTKLFFMAALALMTASCSSNDDNDIAQQPANGEITITATLDANDGATTRVLGIDGDNIASTWEAADQFAILFNDGTSNVKRTATVSSIGGSSVTITFTIPESLANNTDCTIVYPASAANATNTGADVATALATQDGTIGNCPEVRVGTATIDKDNHNLSNVTNLDAQNAIFKFTTKTSDGSATIDVTSLTVTIGTQDYVITPASATSELYAALPAISSQEVTFTATGSDSKTYMASKASVDIAAGKYYQSDIKLTPALNITSPAVGQVIGDNGQNYAYASLPDGVTAVALICYVSGSNGLALALADESEDGMEWDTAMTTAAAHTPTFTGGTWKLATKDEWDNTINAGDYEALRDGFSSVGGTNLKSNQYWSSTKNGDTIYDYYFSTGTWYAANDAAPFYVRACLAF